MRRSRMGLLCLAAAAWGFAPIPQEVAAAKTHTAGKEVFLATEAKELGAEEKQAADLLAGEASIPLPRNEDVVGIEDAADQSEVKVEELAEKVFALADAEPMNRRRGTRTALIGIAGLALFLAFHALAQTVRRAPFSQDVFFKHNSGRVTFSGAGSIVSLALIAAGLAEAIVSPGPVKNRSAVSGFSFPARGATQAEVGRKMLLVSAALIAFGWVIGAPQFIMIAGTTGFFIGAALRVLGLCLLFSGLKRGLLLTEKLYASGLKGRKEDVDLALLMQLLDKAIESDKGLEGLSAEKKLPFAGALLSAAAQPGSKKEGKKINKGAKGTGAPLDAESLRILARHLQELQQRQEKEGMTSDALLREFVNAASQASQELQEQLETPEQADKLP